MIESGIAKVEEYYRAFGFRDVHVSRELQMTQDGKDVNLIFHVHEGLRYTIRSNPQVAGAKSLPVEQLEQLSKIKAGQFYSQPDIESDVTRMKDWYGNSRRDSKVQAIPIFDKHTPGVVHHV